MRTRLAVVLLAVVLLAAVTPGAALGGPTWVDPSFGGKPMTIDLGPGNDIASDLAVQPDGKIVVVGVAGEGAGRNDLAAVRLHPNGNMDTTFGDGGRVILDDGGSIQSAQAVALQADGKIVLAVTGTARNAFQDTVLMSLVRLNADGTVDPSLGGGRVTISTAFGFSGASDVIVQPDGKIVVAGSGRPLSDRTDRQSTVVVARVRSDGSLDSTFGDGGVALVPVRDGYFRASDMVGAAALQPDGRIIVAGGTATGTTSNPFLLRLTSSGAPDPTFGQGGRTVEPVEGTISAVALRPDGSIVTAGARYLNPGAVAAVSRYLANGQPDRSFGAGGTTVSYPPPVDMGGGTASGREQRGDGPGDRRERRGGGRRHRPRSERCICPRRHALHRVRGARRQPRAGRMDQDPGRGDL